MNSEGIEDIAEKLTTRKSLYVEEPVDENASETQSQQDHKNDYWLHENLNNGKQVPEFVQDQINPGLKHMKTSDKEASPLPIQIKGQKAGRRSQAFDFLLSDQNALKQPVSRYSLKKSENRD